MQMRNNEKGISVYICASIEYNICECCTAVYGRDVYLNSNINCLPKLSFSRFKIHYTIYMQINLVFYIDSIQICMSFFSRSHFSFMYLDSGNKKRRKTKSHCKKNCFYTYILFYFISLFSLVVSFRCDCHFKTKDQFNVIHRAWNTNNNEIKNNKIQSFLFLNKYTENQIKMRFFYSFVGVFYALPFLGTMALQMAFEMYCCTSEVYQMIPVKQHQAWKKHRVKIDCKLQMINKIYISIN